MKQIDKELVDKYIRAKNRMTIILFLIGALVSYGVVAIAGYLTDFTVNGMPFHYFMGAQGAIIVFIILMWLNAIIRDKLEKDIGITEDDNDTEAN